MDAKVARRLRRKARRWNQRAKKNRGSTCQVCGHDAGDAIQAHHITPLAAGGAITGQSALANIILVCPDCHDRIHGRLV